MPRKTKDKITENVEVLEFKKSTKTEKKEDVKKESKSVKKSAKLNKKEETKATSKSTNLTKKKIDKTNNSITSTTKKATARKVVAKNSAPKKTTKNKSSSTKKSTTLSSTQKKQTFSSEYYDLPNYYEQTIVKILAQTPTFLFVYWNISNKDISNLLKQYGENFFNNSYPVLLVINKTKNYHFEVEINDYANSWYIRIPDSDCEYQIILIRKSKLQQENHSYSIASSNQLETPNDHILFEKLGKTIFFKNVKTSNIQEKDISSFAFMHNIGKIYNIYDLYKEIYKDELNKNKLNLNFPSS